MNIVGAVSACPQDARLEAWFGRFYGDPALARRVAIWGSPDRCANGSARVVAAGATLLILNPVFDESEQLERLTANVLPRLRPAHAR